MFLSLAASQRLSPNPGALNKHSTMIISEITHGRAWFQESVRLLVTTSFLSFFLGSRPYEMMTFAKEREDQCQYSLEIDLLIWTASPLAIIITIAGIRQYRNSVEWLVASVGGKIRLTEKRRYPTTNAIGIITSDGKPSSS